MSTFSSLYEAGLNLGMSEEHARHYADATLEREAAGQRNQGTDHVVEANKVIPSKKRDTP